MMAIEWNSRIINGLASLLMIALVGLPAHSKDPSMLEQFRWHYRLLLVFSPLSSHPEYRQLDNALRRHDPGLQDRDLRIFRLLPSSGSLDDQPLDRETIDQLRRHFKVADGHYTVVLVGKDGGVKLRSSSGVRIDELFQRIDAMPMRQQEMRN